MDLGAADALSGRAARSGACAAARDGYDRATLDRIHAVSRRVALALLLLAAPAAAGGDDGPPPGGAGDDPVAIEKKRRAELDAARRAIPASAARSLALFDAFRDKDVRVWGSLREDVVAQGADAVPAAVVVLRELDWETRAFAASCLALLGDRAALGPLTDALREETFAEGRRQMVLAIGALASEAARATLVGATKDPHDGVRLAAVEGLARIAVPTDADLFRSFAADEDLDLRYEARGALAELGDEATIASLVAEAEALVSDRRAERLDSSVALDNGDRYAQYLLGLALARTQDRRADKILTAALLAEAPYDHKDFLRVGAATGLGLRARRTGVVHPKLAAGISHKDDRVRVACTYGAGFVGTAELVPRLVKAAADSQLDVRYNAVTALGKIGTDEAAEALVRGLSDRAGEVRVGTVRALGLARSPAATQGLLRAVADDKYMIRVLAARHLARRTTEPGVLEALSKAAKDPDYGVREQALASLSQHPDGAAVLPALAAALDDGDFGVQTNACLGLAKIAPTAPVAADEAIARRVVVLTLGASQAKLVRAGLECLDAVRPAASVLPLIEGLGSDVEETRRRANLALQKMSERSFGFDPGGPKPERDAAQRRWREWWDREQRLLPRGARRAAITGPLLETARDLKWKGLDIALLFDSTGSMAGLINAAKERIDEVIDELGGLLPSVRVSVYTYRDAGDNYLFYGTPLTWDTWKLQGFLQNATHGQGGDIPEAVYDTVKNVCEALRWRKDAHKVVVYAGDAPHHPEQEGAFLSMIRSFFTKESQAALHALYTDTNRRSLDIKARKKRDLSDALRSPTFEKYRRTAEAGRGRAVALDDESALMKELLVLTFGDLWRTDVENLLDFER